jgi:hypothetical protein
MWTVVEGSVTIITVSLPAIDHLLVKLVPSIFRSKQPEKCDTNTLEMDSELSRSFDPRLVNQKENSVSTTIHTSDDYKDNKASCEALIERHSAIDVQYSQDSR